MITRSHCVYVKIPTAVVMGNAQSSGSEWWAPLASLQPPVVQWPPPGLPTAAPSSESQTPQATSTTSSSPRVNTTGNVAIGGVDLAAMAAASDAALVAPLPQPGSYRTGTPNTPFVAVATVPNAREMYDQMAPPMYSQNR